MKTISYIRSDSSFDSVYEQLILVNTYAKDRQLCIDNEFIDQKSQSSRLSNRDEVVEFFHNNKNSALIIYGTWVLSSNIEDLVQMISCLFKNGITIHIVKQSIIIDKDSELMVVLGIMDKQRQIVQESTKKDIGRPVGSRSASKFDKFHNQIIALLRENMSVSFIAREFGVSRSSLKDYIESRELKKIALGDYKIEPIENAEQGLIETIRCPQIIDTKGS
ncbi:MAG: recombinase family protein [Campylobacterota bacterium]|nr:recombinase family protein [Campylobacterota bacterium]